MTPTWLIESEVFQDEDFRLVEELKRQGVSHTVTKFGVSYEDYIKKYKQFSPTVFHGSLQFGSLIRRETEWAGFYCNLKDLNCLCYYPRFQDHLLNSEYVLLPFGELPRKKQWLFDKLGEKVFIRPCSGFKTFTGAVVSAETWAETYRRFGFYKVDINELVVVAPAKKIGQEYRFVVAECGVIAGSEYPVAKTTTPDHPAFHYAQKVVNSVVYEPDTVWTIDVCETDEGFRVVEVGSFSCAGLYACDMEPIVREVTRIVEQEWKEGFAEFSV